MISRPVLTPKGFWVGVRAVRDYVPVDTTSDARKLRELLKCRSVLVWVLSTYLFSWLDYFLYQSFCSS
jgi:hypothetical protein